MGQEVSANSLAPSALRLSYFNIGGKGDPIRMLVRYTGYESFTDYRFADGEFPELKAQGTLTFGQVPALEILDSSGKKSQLFQTSSILRYLGKSLPGNTYPDDPIKAALVDAIMDQEADCFAGVSCSKYKERFGFGSLDDSQILKVRKSLNDEVLPRHLAFFETLLSNSTSGWLADTQGPSICDFLLAPRLKWLVSGQIDGISTSLLDSFPLVNKFIQKFHALECVAKYLSEQNK